MADEPDFPLLEPSNQEDRLQKRIDALCLHFEQVCLGADITGDLIGRIQRAVSRDVDCPVVVTVYNSRLLGYALARPPPLIKVATSPTEKPCAHCNGSGVFLMPSNDSGQSECFRCKGSGSEPVEIRTSSSLSYDDVYDDLTW
jgi:hypothetical protein